LPIPVEEDPHVVDVATDNIGVFSAKTPKKSIKLQRTVFQTSGFPDVWKSDHKCFKSYY
jgi:hypothetical protein